MLTQEVRNELGKALWEECNKYWFDDEENRYLIPWNDLAEERREIHRRLADKVVITHEVLKNLK